VTREWGRQAARLTLSWRRSLRLRMVTTTAVVTAVIVLAIGLFLVDQITNGVLRAKRDAAVAQATLGLDSARAQFSGVRSGDRNGILQAVSQATASEFTAVGGPGAANALFLKAVRSPDPSIDAELPHEPVVSRPLRREVEKGTLAVQYAPLRLTPASEVRSLVVGQPMSTDAGSFELYYFFPLSAEQNTIQLVQQTVLLSGAGLVLLVAAMALLVTRQVVRPIRMAAETAERLAAGDLSQRMRVSGEDDIALLAESFNDMAVSLQQQIQRLEKLSRLQQRFTSDVSHELRTPLTTIRMAGELLYSQRDSFSPELARSAELLTRELDRFESLLADLLEISRYDAGAAALEVERVDLVGIVERAVASSEVLAARHGVQVLTDLGSEPIVAEVDARRIERVLRNLLGNALDHAEGRPVEVRIGADESAVAVVVRDHGVGLRPGEAGLVFNRFWRGDPSRSRLTGGTGLGLAISLEDARLHGGWLQAWGERGRGAVFRLTLPRTVGRELMSTPLPLELTEVRR
jgi:two-component system sensor histidine kinase MtrB